MKEPNQYGFNIFNWKNQTLKQHYVFQHKKEKVQNLLVFLSKLEGSPPRIVGIIFLIQKVQDLLTSNSKSKYIPNVICHYFGRKRHIVSNYKGKA
jgi:hypothetical protein